VETQVLNQIAGGDYWVGIATDGELSFSEKLTAFVGEYTKRMLGSFAFVCTYWVKEKYHHQVPKYVLIFATRSPHGVELMNDFMCQAKRDFLSRQFCDNRLFDCTPDEERVDDCQLDDDILAVLKDRTHPMSRKRLRMQLLLQGYFGRILKKEINAAITGLLKKDKMFSETRKVRINDDVLLSVHPMKGSS
jgi:hypothetical protein